MRLHITLISTLFTFLHFHPYIFFYTFLLLFLFLLLFTIIQRMSCHYQMAFMSPAPVPYYSVDINYWVFIISYYYFINQSQS